MIHPHASPTRYLWGDLWRYRTALLNLTLLRLRVRYNNAALGFFWSLASPLFFMVILSVAFSILQRSAIPNYPVFVLAAILPWNFFNAALLGAISSLPAERDLLTKLAFPRELLPIAVVCAEAVTFAAATFTVSGVLALTGVGAGEAVLALPLLMLLVCLFTAGLGLLLAALNVWLRDVAEIMPVALFGWFFLTPIVYPLDAAAEGGTLVSLVQALNPLAGIVTAFRAVLYERRCPPTELWVGTGAVSVALFVGGMLIFRRLAPYMAEEV